VVKAELENCQLDGEVPGTKVMDSLEATFALLAHVEDVAGATLGMAGRAFWSAPALNRAGGDRSVWILDDDPRLAELVARRLRRAGTPGTVCDAWPETRRGDLVVADLGALIELAAAGRLPAVPGEGVSLIVVTGAVSPWAEAEARRLGASDYLIKPVEMEKLVRLVQERLAEASW
jgi:CheY-like chemotaxis protein